MTLYNETVHDLHEKLTKKEISSVELTEKVFDRIDKVEDSVKAYITLDKEGALKKAREVDQKIAAGEAIKPLTGIPGAIKDNISLKGMRLTCASKILENFQPVYDAHVIENLRKDDTVFIGKTNMDEFAMGSTTETSYFKATSNPWDLTRVPGGSSGGSAAAIAAAKLFGPWAVIRADPSVSLLPLMAVSESNRPMAVSPVMAALPLLLPLTRLGPSRRM